MLTVRAMKAFQFAAMIATEKMNALMYVTNGNAERKLKMITNIFLFGAVAGIMALLINGAIESDEANGN